MNTHGLPGHQLQHHPLYPSIRIPILHPSFPIPTSRSRAILRYLFIFSFSLFRKKEVPGVIEVGMEKCLVPLLEFLTWMLGRFLVGMLARTPFGIFQMLPVQAPGDKNAVLTKQDVRSPSFPSTPCTLSTAPPLPRGCVLRTK